MRRKGGPTGVKRGRTVDSRAPVLFESSPQTKNKPCHTARLIFWWGRVDSNHRRHCQQIYSLSPLATREHPHICLYRAASGAVELVDGLEPPTC